MDHTPAWDRRSSMRKILVALGVAAASAFGFACGDGTGPPVATTVQVSPADVTLDALGATQQFTAQVLDQNGAPMTGVAITWTSTNSAAADVNAVTGVATARANGTTTITATAGSASGSARLTVQQAAVSMVKVSGDGQSAGAGAALANPVVVELRDSRGNGVPGITVQFSVSGGGSVSPSTVSTVASGRAAVSWTLGTDPAVPQTLRATASSFTADFTATATAGPVAHITILAGNNQSGAAGQRLTDSLVVRLTDAFNNVVRGGSVQWAISEGEGSIAPTTATADSSGIARAAWTLGSLCDTQKARATAGSATPAEFIATASTVGCPVVDAITPAVLSPGITATITGSGFAPTAAGNAVKVANQIATVTAASPTQLTITVPSSGFTCALTQNAPVAVTAGRRTTIRQHPLRVAALHNLPVAESAILLAASQVGCNELAAGTARYFVTVFNTSTTGSATAAFRLRGAVGTTTPGAAVVASHGPSSTSAPDAYAPPAPSAASHAAQIPDQRDERSARLAHLRILAANLRALRTTTLGAPPPPAAQAAAPHAVAATVRVPPPQVGDLLPLRVPNLGSGGQSSGCTAVTGRVVYSGNHAVLIEDTLAPLKRTMDSLYVRLGVEYDTLTHTIVVQNFGDPLTRDAQLDNNGRVFMLFSRLVNNTNASAFTYSGDFGPPTTSCGNGAEIFYARVPTTAGGQTSWLRSMRATVAHEMKHVTSFAVIGGQQLWLEEATALIAEELFARRIFGYGWRQNVDYATGLRCELSGVQGCPSDTPVVMQGHFRLLYDYYDSVETRSPLLDTEIASGDFTFYASGWSFVRWAIDHYATDESAFLKALMQSSSGVSNLSARTGRSFAEMLGDWTLAGAVDDLFTPARSQLTLPSWNTRDIFAGLKRDVLGANAREFPLRMRVVPRVFDQEVSVRGGTAAYFDLATTQAGTQLLELLGTAGGSPSTFLRVAIVRVQ